MKFRLGTVSTKEGALFIQKQWNHRTKGSAIDTQIDYGFERQLGANSTSETLKKSRRIKNSRKALFFQGLCDRMSFGSIAKKGKLKEFLSSDNNDAVEKLQREKVPNLLYLCDWHKYS